MFAWLPAVVLHASLQHVLAFEQVGDASASQSPLSFGGFGSMLRHLRRLTDGLDQALRQNMLARSNLKLLQVSRQCCCHIDFAIGMLSVGMVIGYLLAIAAAGYVPGFS